MWEDSAKNKIEFVDSSTFIILLWKVGIVGGYGFTKDSMNRIYTSGYSPAWPPYFAYLKLENTDTLEILFSRQGIPNWRQQITRVKR